MANMRKNRRFGGVIKGDRVGLRSKKKRHGIQCSGQFLLHLFAPEFRKKTMNAYLWKVCGDEYDAAHPQG